MSGLCNRGVLVAVTILYLSLASFPSVSVSARSIHDHEQHLWKDSYKFTTYQLGQNYKGLSNVKRYLHQIGYNIANTPPSNFDDNFDQDLVSSIKTYQKNYNLNPTGKLDKKTVEQLMKPRCGVPDIIKTSLDSDNKNSVQAASGPYYYIGTPWPTKQLSYYYFPYKVIDADFKEAVAKAFYSWTNVTNITFQETYSQSVANITIGFLTGDPFNNSDPEPWAYAVEPTYGEFRLNTNATWVSLPDDLANTPGSRVCDVESLSLHEQGHLLGLGHIPNNSMAVMYPYLESHERKANLTQYDIDAIQNFYNITP